MKAFQNGNLKKDYIFINNKKTHLNYINRIDKDR